MKAKRDRAQVTLPCDLTKLTAEQVAWCVAYHAAMPLREIRRWQELVGRQIGMAWRQRNDFALANLRVKQELLRRAAERKLPPLDAVPAGRRAKPRPPSRNGRVRAVESRRARRHGVVRRPRDQADSRTIFCLPPALAGGKRTTRKATLNRLQPGFSMA